MTKKMWIGIVALILMIFGAYFVYVKVINPTPEPVVVTADPVERMREEQRGDELAVYEEENKVDVLLQDYNDITYTYLSYDEAGAELFTVFVVARKDDLFYMDGSGHIEYLKDGRWIGFNPDDNLVYTMVNLTEDGYQAEWEYLRDSASFYFDTLTVTDNIQKTGDRAVVTRSAKITEDNLAIFQHTWPSVELGDIFQDIYTFDGGIFQTEEYKVVKEDGEERLLGTVYMELNTGIEVDPGILDMVYENEQRSLTLILDPDTENEREITCQTGIGTEFLFALPDGVNEVYMDADCTKPLASQDLEGDLNVFLRTM